jgi:flagellar FliJ protein
MKRFRFPLQPLLDHRQRIEDEKQQILARKRTALDEAERELKRLTEAFRLGSQSLRVRHAHFDSEELRLHYAHLQFIDRCVVAQIHVVAERRVAMDRARAELLVASKDRKVVEKLRARRREAHAVQATRADQIELDDANARQHARSAAGGMP